LAGTLTVNTDTNGVATFNNLVLTGTGNVQLKFFAGDFEDSAVITQPVELVEAGGYHAVITHSGGGGSCAINPITIAVYNSSNQVVTDFEGSITITASGSGNWTNMGGLGTFSNGTANDGIATYTFSAADNGKVTLGFSGAADTYSFTVTSDDFDTVVENDYTISACHFRIVHDGAG